MFWSVANVARQIGVAPSTLRTWDRRYGLGPSEHAGGSHRRYSAADLAKLKYMKRLITNGSPVAEAAQAAKEFEFSEPSALPNWDVNLQAGDAAVRRGLRAAKSLDAIYLDELIRCQIAELGVEGAWGRFIAPLLNALGREWERSGEYIDVEHLASGLIQRALIDYAKPIGATINTRAVAVACIERELHVLPALAFCAALAQRGIAVNFLGPMLPKAALFSYVRKSAPPAVLLWAQLPENAKADYIAEFPTMRPAPGILVAGPGWSKGEELLTAKFCPDLSEAVAQIERIIGRA